MPLSSSGPVNPSPRRNRGNACSTALANFELDTVRPLICKAGTTSTPLVSKAPKVPQKRAASILRSKGPTTGISSIQPCTLSRTA